MDFNFLTLCPSFQLQTPPSLYDTLLFFFKGSRALSFYCGYLDRGASHPPTPTFLPSGRKVCSPTWRLSTFTAFRRHSAVLPHICILGPLRNGAHTAVRPRIRLNLLQLFYLFIVFESLNYLTLFLQRCLPVAPPFSFFSLRGLPWSVIPVLCSEM